MHGAVTVYGCAIPHKLWVTTTIEHSLLCTFTVVTRYCSVYPLNTVPCPDSAVHHAAWSMHLILTRSQICLFTFCWYGSETCTAHCHAACSVWFTTVYTQQTSNAVMPHCHSAVVVGEGKTASTNVHMWSNIQYTLRWVIRLQFAKSAGLCEMFLPHLVVIFSSAPIRLKIAHMFQILSSIQIWCQFCIALC